MKKIIFFMSILCFVCSCGTQEQKTACQQECDSLSIANVSYFEVVDVEEASLVKKQTSMILVGTVPVPISMNHKNDGSLLTLSNGQKVSVPYINVPIGASLVQMPIYVPKFRLLQGDYQPKFKKYGHAILTNGEVYPL